MALLTAIPGSSSRGRVPETGVRNEADRVPGLSSCLSFRDLAPRRLFAATAVTAHGLKAPDRASRDHIGKHTPCSTAPLSLPTIPAPRSVVPLRQARIP